MEHYPILAEFKFTLHFATINTAIKHKEYNGKKVFTLHFATINTNFLLYLQSL